MPHEVTVERLERLQAVQRGITAERLAAELGPEVEVLVEGRGGQSGAAARPHARRTGWSTSAATEAEAPTGSLQRARVVRAGQASLGAELLGPAGGDR